MLVWFKANEEKWTSLFSTDRERKDIDLALNSMQNYSAISQPCSSSISSSTYLPRMHRTFRICENLVSVFQSMTFLKRKKST